MSFTVIIIAFLLIIIFILSIGLIISLRRKVENNQIDSFADKLKSLEFSLNRIEDSLKNEFSINRIESSKSAQEQRKELTEALSLFGKQFSENTNQLNNLLRERFTDFYQQISISNKNLVDSIKDISS